MPRAKAIPTHIAAGQRMKELRLRYGWKQTQISADPSRINAVEAGRDQLEEEALIAEYTSAFRVDAQTLEDYHKGLISCDEFMMRAGVQPGDDDPVAIPSVRPMQNVAKVRLTPWEQDEVEELLVLTLVARGMPRLVAGVVVRSERLKLREYPTWELRIAYLESVREAEDEDARRSPPKTNALTARPQARHSLEPTLRPAKPKGKGNAKAKSTRP